MSWLIGWRPARTSTLSAGPAALWADAAPVKPTPRATSVTVLETRARDVRRTELPPAVGAGRNTSGIPARQSHESRDVSDLRRRSAWGAAASTGKDFITKRPGFGHISIYRS